MILFKSGEILIELKNYDIPISENTRDLFSFVPQTSLLISGTIRENLLLFSTHNNSKKQEKEINNALSLACADFVKELPNGLDTVLKEKGL